MIRGRIQKRLGTLPPREAFESRDAFREWLRNEILVNGTYRDAFATTGARLNHLGIELQVLSRRLVRFMNHHTSDADSDRFTIGLESLHSEIEEILRRQDEEYPHYAYFYGQPYQSLGILGVFGERATEERYDVYELESLIKREDRILDVGCSCGFMSLYTAFRTGCKAHGIDVNPYMIEIGEACARHLAIEDRVTLEACRIQDFEPDEPFTVIFSFATHWTDDENYRVAVHDHLMRLHSWLADDGLLILESHSNDLGDPRFAESIARVSDHFEETRPRKLVDRQTRELLVMRKRSAPADA